MQLYLKWQDSSLCRKIQQRSKLKQLVSCLVQWKWREGKTQPRCLYIGYGIKMKERKTRDVIFLSWETRRKLSYVRDSNLGGEKCSFLFWMRWVLDLWSKLISRPLEIWLFNMLTWKLITDVIISTYCRWIHYRNEYKINSMKV